VSAPEPYQWRSERDKDADTLAVIAAAVMKDPRSALSARLLG
jgi:hypothetical protein